MCMGVLVGGGEKSSIQSHLPFYYTQDQGGVHGSPCPQRPHSISPAQGSGNIQIRKRKDGKVR